ncbi:MAG: hypothetical protein HUN04_15870 [Desulfobacter sp.]|nr:MAG: hypothetical protein HUN04_15870 [Desulfobacter sp.]
MTEEQYLVIANDRDNEGNKAHSVVGWFESKEDAVKFARHCTFYHGYLEDLYGDREDIPSDTELLDKNLRSYSTWPVYLIQTLRTESVYPDYLEEYLISRGEDPSLLEEIRRAQLAS